MTRTPRLGESGCFVLAVRINRSRARAGRLDTICWQASPSQRLCYRFGLHTLVLPPVGVAPGLSRRRPGTETRPKTQFVKREVRGALRRIPAGRGPWPGASVPHSSVSVPSSRQAARSEPSACSARAMAASRYSRSSSIPTKSSPSPAQATAVLPRPVNGSRTRPHRVTPCSRRQVLGQSRGERRRVGAILLAAVDRVVGQEPRVAPAAPVARRRVPASDVRLVLVRHADRRPFQRRRAGRREVKDEFVTVVDEARTVDRLVVSDGQVTRQAAGRPRGVPFDHDRLDPVDRVLKRQVGSHGLRDIHRHPGVLGLGADVEEQ